MASSWFGKRWYVLQTDCWTIQCKPLGHRSIEATRESNRGVKERQRTRKPLKTTPREDRFLKRLTRQQTVSTASTLWSRWIVNGRISRRNINRRLNNARFRARRPIKRPLLTIRHKAARLQWTHDYIEGISGRGRECTGRMKFVLCWILLIAAYAYGDRETQHF